MTHEPASIPRSAIGLLLGLLLADACAEARERAAPPPVYEGDIAELLRERCAGCHGAGDAGAGYRLDGYLRTLSCPRDAPSTPAVAAADAGAPLLDVLARDDHAGLLDAQEQARVAAWIARGVPLRDHGVHEPGVLDPRSPEWHGRLAGADGFARLLDARHPEACGRCHAGTPVTPRGISHAAEGAPACTSCHRQPAGVLACGTCHGDPAARAYPPRDACLFEDDRTDAHAAHVEGGALGARPLVCASCHPRADASLTGSHGDGVIDVRLDPELAGTDARFERGAARCAVSCHDRGGARSEPRWHEAGPMRCGDCHGAPPARHFAGACDGCHPGADAEGTALLSTARHLNGRVDLGGAERSGSECGACHGRGNDPMPDTPSHALHRAPRVSSEIACGECHAVPDAAGSPGHLDHGEVTPADVSFGARARARGSVPEYDAATRSCREVACHGARLADGVELASAWDERPTLGCGACHGLPPRAPHPQLVTCAAVACHGTEVTAGSTPEITAPGRALHVNGTIDHAAP